MAIISLCFAFPFIFQVAWIDKVDRRYAWMKRVLIKFEEDFVGTFPSAWCVEENICKEFCKITRFVSDDVIICYYCHVT